MHALREHFNIYREALFAVRGGELVQDIGQVKRNGASLASTCPSAILAF
ncbi:hypothetical protein AB3X91_34010 [Paraburkholderia sp. BR14263]|uniref:Uncharacterized protein n=2 Tax=Paraburkholderia TaxID=1822464 RepID=A0ACC6RN81_9BURK